MHCHAIGLPNDVLITIVSLLLRHIVGGDGRFSLVSAWDWRFRGNVVPSKFFFAGYGSCVEWLTGLLETWGK